MKTPRVQDFDPNAKIPHLGSPMDNMPQIQKPSQEKTGSKLPPESPLTPTGQEPMTSRGQEVNASTPEAFNAPTGQRPNGSRVIKRHSFEFYKDQVEAIQHLALEEKMQGGKGNQSDMVREAIDDYLLKRKGTQPERANTR